MKKVFAPLKPYLRWFILGGTFFFLLKTLKVHWREVATVRIEPSGWLILLAALVITLLAHIWSGWVWTWILESFAQPLGKLWAIRVYLTTNIAKYLPGNVWHFYGRISTVSQAGGSLGAATFSVLLEPLLMAAAALLIALTSIGLGWLDSLNAGVWGWQILALFAVLAGIHPRLLNPVMHWLSRSKDHAQAAKTVELKSYPIVPLLGEIGFLVLRGTGFLLTVIALQSVLPQQIPTFVSAFSLAWLSGLIVPGAPGGMGVFEAVAIALLDNTQFSPAIILAAVACYRVVSILAEAIAAGLAWLIK